MTTLSFPRTSFTSPPKNQAVAKPRANWLRLGLFPLLSPEAIRKAIKELGWASDALINI